MYKHKKSYDRELFEACEHYMNIVVSLSVEVDLVIKTKLYVCIELSAYFDYTDIYYHSEQLTHIPEICKY